MKGGLGGFLLLVNFAEGLEKFVQGRFYLFRGCELLEFGADFPLVVHDEGPGFGG